MLSAVIVFPASNCDRDVACALEKITAISPYMVWHQETKLPKVDLIVVPGGFSYGDYLRSGAIAARSPIMREVIALAEKGVPVVGFCNGFQVLTECLLLPGALIRNKNLKFVCRDQALNITRADSLFTRAYKTKQITLPIAHFDGNYTADAKTIKSLKDNEQIVFQYRGNPNGSVENIAGICNQKGNVLGMMPHPERAVDPAHGCMDGVGLFKSILRGMH